MIQTVFATQYDQKGYGIGFNGTLPWPRIKKDMDNFRSRTIAPRMVPVTSQIDSYVIMGPKTFMSMPKLKDRISIILVDDPRGELLSLDGKPADKEIVGPWGPYELEQICKEAEVAPTFNNKNPKNLVSIIGGKRLIEASFEFCDRIIWTSVLHADTNPADTFLDKSIGQYLSGYAKFKLVESHLYVTDYFNDIDIKNYIEETILERVCN